jgi:glutaryl-CoA dehydrogenase
MAGAYATFTHITDYMGLEGLLTEEERMIRETARKFVNAEVLPIIEQHAQDQTFPRHLIPKMGELGFFGPSLPEE